MNVQDLIKKLDIGKKFSLSKKIDSVVVVDIGSRLTLLSLNIKDQIRIDALKSVELPKDKKDQVILNSLHDFIKENTIHHKNAILKPSLNSVLIKRIQLPAVPDDELTAAIKWQLKEDVPFDLSAAVTDFSIIKKTTKEDGSKVLDIMCAVAEEKEINKQVSIIKQAGLSCLLVGPSAFGYEKIIHKFMKQSESDSFGVLDLADDICYITVYKNNKLEFYRELPISVNKLKESLRGVLVSDKGRVELTSDEIGEVLFTIGVPEGETNYKDKISSTQILSMIRPVLERLSIEIKRSLSYYDSEFSGGAISKLLIAGTALSIPNIDKFLAKELSLDIEKFPLKDKLTISSGIKQEDLAESYAALGLALDYQEGINLLPYEFQTEKIEKLEKVSLRWVIIIAILLLAVSSLLTKARIGAFQRRLANADLHLNALSGVKQIKIKFDELNNFIADIRNKEPAVGDILKKISSIASNELFFSDFKLDAESKTGSINGFVKSIGRNPDVVLTKFIKDLERSIYFKDATIDNVKKESKHGFDFTEFSISFSLN